MQKKSETKGEDLRVIVRASTGQRGVVTIKDNEDVLALCEIIRASFKLDPRSSLNVKTPNATAPLLTEEAYEEKLADVLKREGPQNNWQIFVVVVEDRRSDAISSQFETGIARVRKEIAQLKLERTWTREDALRLFDNESGCGSEALSTAVKDEAWKLWQLSSSASPSASSSSFGCALCGVRASGDQKEENFSVACVLAGNPEKALLSANSLRGLVAVNKPRFKDDYEFNHVRNCFVLCGKNNNDVGSCHWAYDNHHVGVLYNPLVCKFEVMWFDTGHLNELQKQSEVLHVPTATTISSSTSSSSSSGGFNPRKRGFTFHFLEGVRRAAKVLDETLLQSVATRVSLSLAEEEFKNGDSESDDPS